MYLSSLICRWEYHAVVILFVIGQPAWVRAQSDNLSRPTDYFETLRGWSYRWGDSPFDAQGVPSWTRSSGDEGWQPAPTLLSPPGENKSFLWLRVRLPAALPARPALSTRYIWLSVEVYVDTTLIYRSGRFENDPTNKYNGQKPHLIALPEDSEGGMLYLRIFSNFSDIIGLPNPVSLSTEDQLIDAFLRNDLATLVIGIILSVSGIMIMLLSFRKRDPDKRWLLLFTGLFSFCYGTNYACSHAAIHFIFSDPVLIYHLIGLFLLFPVGLLGLFMHVVGAGYRRIIFWLMLLHLALWVTAMILDLFNILPYFLMGFPAFTLLAVSLIAIIITVIPAIRQGRYEARIFGIGMVIAIVPGLFDTIFQGILFTQNIPSISPWGVLIFMIILGYLLDYRFTETTRNLRKAHHKLEAYSATLEQRVKDRTAELSAKNEALIEALDELRSTQDQLIQSEKMASLGQLTAGIAHEIKNPLNFVNNFASLSVELAQELDEALSREEDVMPILEDLKMNAAQIAKHGQRADHIVRGMMQHASGHSGPYQSVDVNAHVEQYVNLAYHGMRARHPDFNVTIERHYSNDVGNVEMMPQEIGRVLINLFNNAFDAMREHQSKIEEAYDPKMTVSTRRVNNKMEICVADNGVGIPDEVRDRVFEPFFTTKPAGSGTGLGLSLSYDIVVNGHGGQLTAVNNETGGASFIIKLPA